MDPASQPCPFSWWTMAQYIWQRWRSHLEPIEKLWIRQMARFGTEPSGEWRRSRRCKTCAFAWVHDLLKQHASMIMHNYDSLQVVRLECFNVPSGASDMLLFLPGSLIWTRTSRAWQRVVIRGAVHCKTSATTTSNHGAQNRHSSGTGFRADDHLEHPNVAGSWGTHPRHLSSLGR